jgi:uncharacterized phage protein (TIGR01671 family)
MREIKFRVWDKITKKYFYSGTLDNGDVLVIHLDGEIEISSDDTYKPDDFIIEELTGLLDKNGREIYEGDIVSDGMWQSYGCLNGTHEVKFEDGGFYPFCVPKWECTMDIKGCEVIGNIHENPELLS